MEGLRVAAMSLQKHGVPGEIHHETLNASVVHNSGSDEALGYNKLLDAIPNRSLE